MSEIAPFVLSSVEGRVEELAPVQTEGESADGTENKCTVPPPTRHSRAGTSPLRRQVRESRGDGRGVRACPELDSEPAPVQAEGWR